jgi:hypothetical protein
MASTIQKKWCNDWGDVVNEVSSIWAPHKPHMCSDWGMY